MAETQAEREQRLTVAAERLVRADKAYVDRVLHEYLPRVTRWWRGTATALNTGARSVTVQLDPFPNQAVQRTVPAGYGRAQWAPGQIVGKRVRVMLDLDGQGAISEATVDDVTDP
jgi:hypothetical protein